MKAFLFVVLFLISGCGTYSLIRPADNLAAGGFEFTGGFAANSFGEVLPVLKGNYGVTSWLEVGAQYEIYTLMGEVRFGLLKSKEDGVALALGLQGGLLQRADSSSSSSGGGLGPTIVFGKKWDLWELYIGGKAFTNFEDFPAVLSGKVGGRFYFDPKFFLGLEGGGTAHFWGGSSNGLGEGTLYCGLSI